MSRPVAITAQGAVSAAGLGVAAALEAAREARSGLSPLTCVPAGKAGPLPVGQVPCPLPPGRPRALALAALALEELLAQAGLSPERRARTALVLGITVGGMPESERAFAALRAGQDPGEEVWLQHESGATGHALAGLGGLGGPVLTVSTACSSGAQALALAADLIRAGRVEAAVAGGVDALCRLTVEGFASLLAVDPAGCRPFDRGRRGMSLGEGAALLLLEADPGPRAPLAWLVGAGSSCDAHHPTAPHPEGRGAEAAIRAALAAAGRAPGEVGYVNAHGTGTPDNDRAEGLALARVFGAAAPPVSSTKRVFGHTLAAAGALEAVVAIGALRQGFLPGTAGLEEPDPACAIVPLAETRAGTPRLVLSDSFGFGGNNTALLFAGEGEA